MKTVKRKPRTYKVADKYYNGAMERAKREEIYLASLIERVVIAYGTDCDMLGLFKELREQKNNGK